MPLRRRGTCQSLNLKTAKALGLEDYADQDYTPQYHGVIAAIAHKHTKVTPESPVAVEFPVKGLPRIGFLARDSRGGVR